MRTSRHVYTCGARTLLVAACALMLNVAAMATASSHSQYSGTPSHRELASRALELALLRGFSESGMTVEDLRSRLEAGAFLEDFESIPGVVGRFYPDPWNQLPAFDYGGYLTLETIPVGALADTLSGWRRGLAHGFDPLTGYRWPGSRWTTVAWAEAAQNAFRWQAAVQLYRDGKVAEAYQTLGHVLHLLCDLSVPSHVMVVDHGSSLTAKHSGMLWDPDLAKVIVDEYEMALAGGLAIDNVPSAIPDLHGVFLEALAAAREENVPLEDGWAACMDEMASLTASMPEAGQFYRSPQREGEFGAYRDYAGNTVEPRLLGTALPAEIGGRWTQFVVKTTVRLGLPPDDFGPILPESIMVKMARHLVPRAAELCAGVLLAFQKECQTSVSEEMSIPKVFALLQNYPNPFNGQTVVGFQVSESGPVSLCVYDVVGRPVAVLVDRRKEPGTYAVTFDAARLASGVYLCRLKAGDAVQVRTMVLMR